MYNHKVRGRGRTFYRSPRNNETPNNMNSSQEHQIQLQASRNISKHDNNCCRDITLSLDLDESEQLFFGELKRIWTMLKKSPPVINMLCHYFNTCANPYVQVLRLLFNCQEFYSAKSKTLPFFIIEEFKNWSTSSRNKIIHLLTPQLKMDAFKIITKQNSMLLTKLVGECFEFLESKNILLDIIHCKIQNKQYKEACQFASLLKLHDNFSIEDFIIPLILQDKFFGIEEFLMDSPKHQIEVVTWLDDILVNNSVKDAVMDYVLIHSISDVKVDKFHAKPWKKLITRIVKTFKLSSDLTPNLNKRRNEGALQFILHRRFIDNSFSDDSYKEMVHEAVGNDEDLQKELISQVSMFGENSEALRWAHFYKVDRQYWPYGVRLLDENPNGDRQQQKEIIEDEECWDDVSTETVEYHKFSLPLESIRLIDLEETFESFLNTGLQDVDIVGIDCEWKPSFGNHPSELALLQIATRKSVFILDIINLGNKVPHLWQQLGKSFFNNCDILKLGFSLTSDISMIKQALPELNFSPKQIGFLDLCSLWKQLERYPKIKLPYEVKSGGPSLTTLVQHCVGKPLDKSDQFSNWEKRPLRDNQLKYAALDAYCLIEVYDILKLCCENGEFPFEEVCYNLMTNEKTIKKKPKPKKPINRKENPTKDLPQPENLQINSIPANELKIVCDTMLQGLVKNLRRVGINTKVLENHQDHMECVRYAQNENRFILTKGFIFNKLCGYVPQGCCLKIISDDVDEQLKEVIDYYKVIVTKNDIFSRCQCCNGNSFIKVSKSTMKALSKSVQNTNLAPPCYFEEEATGFSSDEDLDEASSPIGYSLPPVSIDRKWDLYSDEKIDVGLCQTSQGARIQIRSVPQGVIEKNEFFYVCEECGKVYWDGTHYEKVVKGRLQGIVQ